jgi:NTE family protein
MFQALFSLTGQSVETEQTPCRLGMVLSGGAARGIAHIGVLKAFEENGIEIDYFSGASMGAIIALFSASGKTADEMLDIALQLKKRKLKKFGKLHIGKVGIDYIGKQIDKHIPQKSFEELEKPLFVCLTNMGTGNFEIFSTGAILPPLKATAAIPVKYKEQDINGMTYVDGGMLNNLPVEPLRDRCTTVVGISVNPMEEKTGKLKLRTKVVRLIDLVVNENETRRVELCDFHLEVPGLGAYDLEEYDKAQEIYDLGYQAAKVFIAENPELLTFKTKNHENSESVKPCDCDMFRGL